MTYADTETGDKVLMEYHVTQTSPRRAHVQTFETEAEAREYARLWRDWNPHATCVVVGQGRRRR